MKKIFLLLKLLLTTSVALATGTVDVFINDQQMVVLSFPSEVKYVDFGSADIKGNKTNHKNILAIKSHIPHFEETTASVVTADGNEKIYIIHTHTKMKGTQADYKRKSSNHKKKKERKKERK